MQKVFTVMSRALEELGRRGVRDVFARLSARVLPPEKPGAEERALELATEAIAELHVRGLEAMAAGLAAELGIEAPASARLAGSTVAPHPDEPPPAADAPPADEAPLLAGPGSDAAAVADQVHVTPAAPLTAEDRDALGGDPVVDPPPHADGSPRGLITDERAAGMLAPEGAPAPVVIDELHQQDGKTLELVLRERAAAGVEAAAAPSIIGMDLASGPDVAVVVPAAAPAEGAPWTPEDDAAFRDLEAAEAGKASAEDAALRQQEGERVLAEAQAELPAGGALPEDLPPAAPAAPEAPADAAPAPDAPPAS